MIGLPEDQRAIHHTAGAFFLLFERVNEIGEDLVGPQDEPRHFFLVAELLVDRLFVRIPVPLVGRARLA